MIIQTSKALIELLFLRSVWSLEVAASLPAADPPPNPSGSTRPGGLEAEALWESLWRSAVTHLGSPSDQDFWGLVNGLEGVNRVELRHWTNTFVRKMNDISAEYHNAPETLLRGSIEKAQRKGLAIISVLPLAGAFALVEDRCLLVSFSTYVDGSALKDALEVFHS